MKTLLILSSIMLTATLMAGTPIARTSNNGKSSPPGQVSVSCAVFPNGRGTAFYQLVSNGLTYTLYANLLNGDPALDEIGGATIAQVNAQLKKDKFIAP